MDTLPKLPTGWIYVDRANSKGIFKGSRKDSKTGESLGSFEAAGPIWVPVPEDIDAQHEAFETYKRTFRTMDGEVTFKGFSAALMNAYYQAWECLRQAACDDDHNGIYVDEEHIQGLVATIEPLSGKRGGRKAEAPKDELEALLETGDIDEVAAFLRQHGMKIK